MTVPLPKRMRALQRDRRGYPVPFIVLRDKDNRPHFTINDSEKVVRCLRERRCAICGNRLDPLMWWVGGPNSAFHERGAYIDTALHYDCMTYALQVCPYLAAPKYAGRIDAATVNPERMPDYELLLNPTMIPVRPSPFVAVAARQFAFNWNGITHVSVPVRPYAAIEYWDKGVRLDPVAGLASARAALLPRPGE